MSKLPEEWLNELKERNNIVDVVSHYVKLNQKTGNNYFACCPFHNEKTPSFCVNEDGQFYYCFSCHAGGDVINFIRQMENLTFMEAIKLLAERANMTLPEFIGDNRSLELKKEKEALSAIMVESARQYHNNLLTDKRASSARAYLESRGVNLSLIKRFGLGYSVSGEEIFVHLKNKGFGEKQILDSGVCEYKNGRYYDALAGRIIFPIIDGFNQVIAFGGRVLEKTKIAKYKNTKETLLFEKGNNLYGINLVKKFKKTNQMDKLIIVEGYMDVIALHKAGIQNVVASMGTALTIPQIRLMKRFSNNICISYDGDSAGQNATLRGLNMLKAENADVTVLTLPDGMDPDDVIQKLGKEKYLSLISDALPLTEYVIENLAKKYNLEIPDGRAKYANAALKELSKLSSATEKEVYLSLVQKRSGIALDVLRRQLFDGEFIIKAEKLPVNKTYSENESAYNKALKYILYSMLNNKKFVDFSVNLSPYLKTDAYMEIYNYIEDCVRANKEISISYALDNLESKEELEDILNNGGEGISQENEKGYYEDCVNMLKAKNSEKTKENLLKMYNAEIDTDRKKQILMEIQKLTLSKKQEEK